MAINELPIFETGFMMNATFSERFTVDFDTIIALFVLT